MAHDVTALQAIPTIGLTQVDDERSFPIYRDLLGAILPNPILTDIKLKGVWLGDDFDPDARMAYVQLMITGVEFNYQLTYLKAIEVTKISEAEIDKGCRPVTSREAVYKVFHTMITFLPPGTSSDHLLPATAVAGDNNGDVKIAFLAAHNLKTDTREWYRVVARDAGKPRIIS